MNLCYAAGYGITVVLGRLFFRFRILHRERRILKGPLIVAMNHESYLDPPLAGIASGREMLFFDAQEFARRAGTGLVPAAPERRPGGSGRD